MHRRLLLTLSLLKRTCPPLIRQLKKHNANLSAGLETLMDSLKKEEKKVLTQRTLSTLTPDKTFAVTLALGKSRELEPVLLACHGFASVSECFHKSRVAREILFTLTRDVSSQGGEVFLSQRKCERPRRVRDPNCAPASNIQFNMGNSSLESVRVIFSAALKAPQHQPQSSPSAPAVPSE